VIVHGSSSSVAREHAVLVLVLTLRLMRRSLSSSSESTVRVGRRRKVGEVSVGGSVMREVGGRVEVVEVVGVEVG